MNGSIEILTLARVCEWTGGVLIHGDAAAEVRAVTTDSRSVPARSLFVALVGDRFDGHDYFEQAAERGARAALVSRRLPSGSGIPQILVSDTTKALGDLAAGYRRLFRPVVTAITGTSGKTTNKEMLAAICRRRYRTLATTGNLNNLIGVPLTLLGMTSKTEKAIVEMGMNIPGEIAREAEIADPDIGVITSIGHGHIAGLGSIDGVLRAKAELIEHLNARNGAVVLSADQEHFDRLSALVKCELVSVGESDAARVKIRNVSARGYDPAVFTFRGIPVRLRMAGRHAVSNAALAAAAAERMGVDPIDIVSGLSEVFPDSRRGARVEVAGISIVDDSYNANPLSYSAALAMLKGASANRKIVVMGDMLELGEDSTRLHEQIGREIAASGVDILVYRGEGSAAAASVVRGIRAVACETNEEMIRKLEGLLLPGDLVLMKGSHGMRIDEVVDGVIERRRTRKSDVIPLKR